MAAPAEECPCCELCFPPEAEAAWAARSGLKFVADLIDESHYHVMVLACPSCGQHFVSVFTETIDWQDGDDPQYWSLLPLTAGESRRLVDGPEPDNATLQSLGPSRRCLNLSHPKGQAARTSWTKGLSIGWHD
jgi:hypothetical protein